MQGATAGLLSPSLQFESCVLKAGQLGGAPFAEETMRMPLSKRIGNRHLADHVGLGRRTTVSSAQDFTSGFLFFTSAFSRVHVFEPQGVESSSVLDDALQQIWPTGGS